MPGKMTDSEAKGFIQGKLDCMKKCDIFNKEDNTSDNDCDNCQYCYSQGTFGEQKEAFKVAINALEKQIPKKPIEYEDKFYACPVCKSPVMYKWEKYNTELMEKSNGLPVCLNCLQAIDWSDEE